MASPFFVDKGLGLLLPRGMKPCPEFIGVTPTMDETMPSGASLYVAGETFRWTNATSGSGRRGGEAASIRYFGSAPKAA
ncbi:hypothetical protein ACWKWJ_11475 [Sphingopyxis terrae subsp. ummariensis]